ncbi:MAG TPA: deoxyguanosinetriphosphate triphosphohydrolase [Dehalococcoidia bacterium]|nr:deoxyguanosinetriphosphate triphosphohydrolase [Dehalococcoidia bacterium]
MGPLDVRQRLEEKEESLSPYAAKSRLSRGRLRAEPSCPLRTAFQRDRDRIIHSKAFRRLKHKTQVFIAPLGDHYVTRLTHTLEVAQIARTISRALNLNEDLTEAIALGHDLGHTPFGHVGEEVLDELYPGGFRHNEQSLRVVDLLEKEGQGLNLTWEVREGILHHSKAQSHILGKDWGPLSTLEAQVCRLADIVAYINHDLADAIRAGILKEGELPRSILGILGAGHSRRINTLVDDIVASSWAATGLVESQGRPTILMSPRVLRAANGLRRFLFRRVYSTQAMVAEAQRAREVVRLLYHYFLEHPEELPADYARPEEDMARQVVDYIAGMTDQFALRLAAELSPRQRHLLLTA